MTLVSTSYNAVFNEYALGTDPNIIQEQSLFAAWGENKDEAALVATLNMLQGMGKFGRSIKTKSPVWAIGDYPEERATLGATFAFDATTIQLTEKRFFENDMLYIHDGTDYALVRLGAFSSGTYIYNATIVETTKTSGSFATTSTVFVNSPAVTYDDEARKFLNVKPNLIGNQMQRMRDTVGAGQLERSEVFLADHSLQRLVKLGFKSFAKKMNNAIHFNMTKDAPASGTAEDYGIFGGLPYFLNPHGATGSVANDNVKGINKVFSGTSIDYADLIDWSQELTQKGMKDKLIFLSPFMMTKMLRALEGKVSLERRDYMGVNLGYERVWNDPVAEMAFGSFKFIVDRGLAGGRLTVKDKDTPATIADSLHWMVAIDPSDIGLIYLDAEGMGTMTPQIRNVLKERNNSVEEIEFDSAMTLAVGDPELHGYFGITNA